MVEVREYQTLQSSVSAFTRVGDTAWLRYSLAPSPVSTGSKVTVGGGQGRVRERDSGRVSSEGTVVGSALEGE